jgi:hypothetical protein
MKFNVIANITSVSLVALITGTQVAAIAKAVEVSYREYPCYVSGEKRTCWTRTYSDGSSFSGVVPK